MTCVFLDLRTLLYKNQQEQHNYSECLYIRKIILRVKESNVIWDFLYILFCSVRDKDFDITSCISSLRDLIEVF